MPDLDRSGRQRGRAVEGGRGCFGGCSWCWRLDGRVSGAYPPTCVLRCLPPLLAAALRALLVVAGSAAATVATAWSWPSQRARAALLILHAPQIAAAQAGRGGVKLLERGGSAARRVAVPAHRGAPDRVASAALDRGLQLDGAMSSPGPAAKLALKRQTGLMGGDMGLAATTAAAQAQRSAAAAQPAAAAAVAATGAYDLQAMARASQSLPVVPARSSTTGRPAAPPHPYFVAGRDRGRGRGRGSPQQWCSQQRCRRRRRRRQRQRRRWPQQPQ